MVEFKNWRTLIAQKPYILGTYYIIKIFFVLHSANIVSKDQEKTVFYINNYIDGNNLTNYMILTNLTKIYKIQMQLPIDFSQP